MPILWEDMCIEWKVLLDQTPTKGQLKSVRCLNLYSTLTANHQTIFDDDLIDIFASVLDVCASKRLQSIKFTTFLSKDGLQLLLDKLPTVESLAFDRIEALGDYCNLISSFNNLKELSISHCDVKDEHFVNVSDVKSLRKVSIVGCWFLTGKFLTYIGQNVMLRHLVIARCAGIGSRDYTALVSKLKELQHLELYNNQLDKDFCRDALKYLNLKQLNIAWTGVSNAGISDIGKVAHYERKVSEQVG